MLSVNRIIKFVWFLSLLLFVSGLLYGYYLLPDVVCVRFDSAGNPLDYVDRPIAFYGFSGLFASFNILLLLLESFTLMLPNRLKPVLNKQYWLSDQETNAGLNYILSDWFFSFAIAVNASILAIFYVFAKINIEMQSSILQYSWVLPAVCVFIGLWVLYLPIRLSISKIFIR